MFMALGMLFHVALDMIYIDGVSLLYPFYKDQIVITPIGREQLGEFGMKMISVFR